MKSRVKEKLISIKQALLAEPNLYPQQRVDWLFEGLIEWSRCAGEQIDQSWLASNCVVLNQLCARGEGMMEEYWVEKFLAKKNLSVEDLREFKYFQNYEDLSEWEIGLVKDYLGYLPRRILLVGSGSLPLSAILWNLKTGVKVECWDCDNYAVERSRKLMERLGLSENIEVKLKDFFDQQNFESFDLVMGAALLGITEKEKEKVVKHLEENLAAGQTVLLRTSENLKVIFYQPVKLDWLNNFKDVKIFNPENFGKLEIINSVILAKKS